MEALTFRYTTGERLLEANILTHLSVHEEERQVLWRALRERSKASQQYVAPDLPELPRGPEILAPYGAIGNS